MQSDLELRWSQHKKAAMAANVLDRCVRVLKTRPVELSNPKRHILPDGVGLVLFDERFTRDLCEVVLVAVMW